jgi:hypothetical protein
LGNNVLKLREIDPSGHDIPARALICERQSVRIDDPSVSFKLISAKIRNAARPDKLSRLSGSMKRRADQRPAKWSGMSDKMTAFHAKIPRSFSE